MSKRRYKAIVIAFSVLFAALLSGCSEKPIVSEGFAMDTFITITVYRSRDDAAAKHCLTILDEYDRTWSAYREDSEIFKLNQTGAATLVGDTAALVETSLHLAAETSGVFDPTVYPLSTLWHLRTRTGAEPLPTDAAIADAKAYVGYKRAAITPAEGGISVKLLSGMGFDLGGIAKGFAGDKLKEYMRNAGVSDAIINLGGNVVLIGNKTRSVGLADPRSSGIFGKLDLADVHVITSGDYQRYIMVNGKRIHHIIDPQTGRSSESGLMSVTIVGKNGAQCDAMSTAVFVLGVEKGLELVRAQGLEAVLVTNDNKIYLTQGLKGVFTLTNTAYAIQ